MFLYPTTVAAVMMAFGVSDTPQRCDRGAPAPFGFHARGFGMVAEIFPPDSRNNDTGSPRAYMYRVAYPGPRWESRAEHLWTAALPHEEFPLTALVSPDGHLITFDDHSVTWLEADHAVVLFDSSGAVLHDYSLVDLFSREELDEFEVSDCGYAWRADAQYFFVLADTPRFYVLLGTGGVLQFDLRSGALARGEPSEFTDLEQVLAREFANEQSEIWAIPLRFSSITDRMEP